MAANLEKTKTPGIYRRHAQTCKRGSRCACPYVIVYRGPKGAQEKRSFRTLDEARAGKGRAQREVKLAKAHGKGDHRDAPQEGCPECDRARQRQELQQPMLHRYAREWVDRYHGTGRRGFREETRIETRRLLERYALEFFPEDTRVGDVSPLLVAEFIGWLVKQPSSRGGTLSDSSIRNALAPLSACLATARREGVIEHNPCTNATLPHRPQIEEDEGKARPFPPGTMEMVVSLINPKYRLMFELLAATGLRRSELLALEVKHLALDGAEPHVRVRQRVRRRKLTEDQRQSRGPRGVGLVIGPLKSAYARREVPIDLDLADRLRSHIAGRASAADLVFATRNRTIIDPDNLSDRILAPACEEAGVEWAGMHTFRHTVASQLFQQGRDAKKVQHWLGHHSASFTMNTYVHLLDAGDLGGPLRGNQKANDVSALSDTRMADVA